jgi:hypothetical protein
MRELVVSSRNGTQEWLEYVGRMEQGPKEEEIVVDHVKGGIHRSRNRPST